MINEAIKFASLAHMGMKRKGNNQPYIFHPLEVMSLVSMMTLDEEVLCAAILHDTVEDTDVSIEDIKENFSDRVASLVNYESEDGWSVTYNTGEFELSEIDPHTVQFTYLGASSGSDVVSISWIEGKGPEEVLGEKTEGVEDPESIQRSEGFFPGTEDMWGYWRVIPDSGEGSGLNETLIAGEYNGGVLMFVVESVLPHRTG